MRYQVIFVLASVVFCAALLAQENASNTTTNSSLSGAQTPAEIHVDEKCRISKVIPDLGGSKPIVYKDKKVCSVDSEKVSKRDVMENVGGQQKQRTVTIREHTFSLHNSGGQPVAFVVEQKVPNNWQVDSDPQPKDLIGGVATFLVNAEPGQTVNLHVGERTPPAVAGEQIVQAETEVEFTPPPNVAGHSAWIPLDYQAQETNLCVPTSASIILDYFGDEVSPREIKELSMGRQYSPDKPFNDFTITLFRDLISGLQRLGYSWHEVDYADNLNGFWDGVAQIEHSLDGGIPVMVDTTTDVGHTFVVAGYSTEQESLYAIDPSLPAPGTRVVEFSELQNIWNSNSVHFDKRSAVFPQRKKAKD